MTNRKPTFSSIESHQLARVSGGAARVSPQSDTNSQLQLMLSQIGESIKSLASNQNKDGSNQMLLTANIGHNIFPGWSPDSKRIIFSSSKRDATSTGSNVLGSFLYIMNADGSGLKKLGQINSFFARFSPDGKRIAYVSGDFPKSAIYIADADGSAAVQITKP